MIEPATGRIDPTKNPNYRSVMEGIGPGGVPEKGKSLGERAEGLGKGLAGAMEGLALFIPDLAVETAVNPG